MYLLNGKRINIHGPVTVNDVQYPHLRDPELRLALGVTEVPDPAYPDPDLYFWTENPDGTLNVTPKAPEQVLQAVKMKFIDAVQAHLDQAAQVNGYDHILSACSYAGGINPFQAEGQAFVDWRGNVWAFCYQELARVEAGEIPVPVLADFLASLPVLSLP